MQNNNIPVCDLHCDTIMNLSAGSNLHNTNLQVNLPFMREANINIQVFACFVPYSVHGTKRYNLLIEMIDRMNEEIQNNASDLMLCTDYKMCQQAIDEKKIGIILAMENGIVIENDIAKLADCYNKGIRYMTLVHSRNHEWAISCTGTSPLFDGLTEFGEKVIAAMNEMGMIIDVSHAHDSTIKKVLKISKRPVIASHSCVYNICDSKRNLTDELIKGIADSGGMIGINFFNGFLDKTYLRISKKRIGPLLTELTNMENSLDSDLSGLGKLYEEFQRKYKFAMYDVNIQADKIIDHIEYIIQLVGDDYVGFGSDFDGIPHSPVGIEDCRGFKLLERKLYEKGYSDKTIEKIAYKNFLRVFKSHLM